MERQQQPDVAACADDVGPAVAAACGAGGCDVGALLSSQGLVTMILVNARECV